MKLRDPFIKIVMLLAVLSIAVFPSYAIFFAYPSFTGYLTRMITDESVRVAKHLSASLLAEGVAIRSGRISPEIIEDIRIAQRDFQFMKLKIYEPEGKVIFSTDPADIGKVNTGKYFHETVAKGRIFAVVIDRNTPSMERQIVTADVVETYVPIMHEGSFIGAFEIYYDITKERQKLHDIVYRSTAVLFIMAFMLLIAVVTSSWKTVRSIGERRTMEGRLRVMAETDSLTGIFNRRKLMDLCREEIERAKRYDHPLSMIMFDLDRFKDVNDAYGHDAGDYVLKSVVDKVKSGIRNVDIIARFGGEEFVILAPETEGADASALAEKLRNTLEHTIFGQIGRVTVSVGVTQYRDAESMDSFFKRADDALYEAKRNGRNSVVTRP